MSKELFYSIAAKLPNICNNIDMMSDVHAISNASSIDSSPTSFYSLPPPNTYCDTSTISSSSGCFFSNYDLDTNYDACKEWTWVGDANFMSKY